MTLKLFFKGMIQCIIVILGISFITFLLTYMSPGDPAELMLTSMGTTPTEAQVEATREKLGLDKSFTEQYTNWLFHSVQGDFGKSYYSGHPVIEELAQKLPATLKLAIVSLLATLIISIPLGILTAVYQNKWIDYLIRGISFIGISMPSFLVALFLLYIFGLKLGLFPILSMGTGIKEMVLPVASLTFAMSVKYIRQIRNLVLEELRQGYVDGARARGIVEIKILFCHVFPNVLLPIVTLVGMSFGSLLGGTALIEIVFSWPGLGKLAVESITRRDYPIVQAYVLWLALIYMVVNFIVDASYKYLDPRVRKERDK